MEKNPGPTTFYIIDPVSIVSAEYSQGNEALFGEHAGKQYVAVSLAAIIYHQIEHISKWTSKLTDKSISSSRLNFNCCFLTVGINAVAVFKHSEQSFKNFTLMQRIFMVCHVHSGMTLLEILVSYLQMSCLETGVVPLEIKGVFITDCQPELENVHNNQENEQFSLSVKITQNNSLTEKCSDETAEIKKKLIGQLEYEKKKRANESEESRQKKLTQKRENRRKKQESRQKRLASQSKYQKEKKC